MKSHLSPTDVSKVLTVSITHQHFAGLGQEFGLKWDTIRNQLLWFTQSKFFSISKSKNLVSSVREQNESKLLVLKNTSLPNILLIILLDCADDNKNKAIIGKITVNRKIHGNPRCV